MQEEVGRLKNGRRGGRFTQVLDAGDCVCPGGTRAHERSRALGGHATLLKAFKLHTETLHFREQRCSPRVYSVLFS